MKILVLGASGMAGHVIALYLNEQGYDVTAFSRTKFQYLKSITGDALINGTFKNIISHDKFDVIINCIGILNKSADDKPADAVYLNSFLPHHIADLIKDTPTKLIHMSTDCVFAGNTGPYTESSFPDGKTFYDRTKALGEIRDTRNITFRNSIIGPDINENGIGLFHWFMKQQGEVNGFTGAIWTGVTTLTLAKAMEHALKVDLTGIYNLVNGNNISKYNLLQLFNKHFRNNSLSVTPSDLLKLDKTLVTERSNEFDFQVPSYEQMVIEMKEWIIKHKELYPLYK